MQRGLSAIAELLVIDASKDQWRILPWDASDSKLLAVMRQICGEFILQDLLPPNITDLNPIDYKIWEKCSSRSIKFMTSMKSACNVWHRFKQSIIDDALDGWRKCLCAWICVTFWTFNLTLIIIIIITVVLIKVTLNKVIAGALYIVICGWNAVKVLGWQLTVEWWLKQRCL